MDRKTADKDAVFCSRQRRGMSGVVVLYSDLVHIKCRLNQKALTRGRTDHFHKELDKQPTSNDVLCTSGPYLIYGSGARFALSFVICPYVACKWRCAPVVMLILNK